MLTCEYAGPAFGERSHPWSEVAGKPECRYHDLKATPERIRSSMEDLVPWRRYPAIERFYELIEQINAPGGALESNDCAFTGPAANEHSAFAKALQCSGRVMVLFSRLELNTAVGQIESLTTDLHLRLARIDPQFQWGMVGTTIIPVRYLALPEAHDQQHGTQLMISFWAWGNSEHENMRNLGRVLTNLSCGLAQMGCAPS